MKSGGLVSNDAVLQLLETAMRQVETTSNGFLIDGSVSHRQLPVHIALLNWINHFRHRRYPREKSQGSAFEKAIAPVDIILYFECQPETMVSRILKRAEQSAVKRADDNEETIRTRIQTFVQNTDEILVQYPTQTRRVSWTKKAPMRNKFDPSTNRILSWFSVFGFRSTGNVQSMRFSPMLLLLSTLCWHLNRKLSLPPLTEHIPGKETLANDPTVNLWFLHHFKHGNNCICALKINQNSRSNLCNSNSIVNLVLYYGI